jgi:plastocyanin domain-containing protein
MKIISYLIVVGAMLIGGGIIFLGSGSRISIPQTQNNVSIVDGKQIIEINARGGYAPRYTTAEADVPTAIKVKTSGTFDCSAAIVIPRLGYRKNLPPTGETLIDVPPQKAGTTLQALCAMGMYNFVVKFE